MDGTNAGGPPPRAGPPGNNILMRPPPPHGQGQGQGNGIARPPHPARPPPHQQPQEHQRLQQLQPSHTAQNPAARSPVMSPFHKPEGGSSGSSPQPLGQGVRPVQNSPPGQHSIQIPVRPPGPGGPGMNQQRPASPHQQHPQRPHPPPGQQPPFGNPGRPLLGPNNPGSQGQLRPSGSPQAQPMQVHPRPPMQGQQPPQPNNINGQSLRPSSSHPNLTGAAPPVNRFTPPSPSLTTTRSPQIRPLQQTQPQGHPQQQPTLRPSGSHPHLAQSRPPMPPAQQSPVLAHQTLNIRPPTPMMQQQQVRPRPPQGPPGQSPARPHGHPSPRQAPMQAVQVEIPTSDIQTNGGNEGLNRPTQSSSMPHLPPQQRPPRPTILDQMRQSPQSHPGSVPPHSQNPTQRQPLRPPTPQGQQGPFRQGSGSGSPQRLPTNDGSHPSSADQSPKGPEHGQVQEVSLNGDHGRLQQHAIPSNQRLGHPPQNANHGAPTNQGHPGQPQHPQQRFNVPPSPGQRPLGATIPGVKPGPPPQNQVRPPPQQPEPQAVTLAEPDAPLSDSNDEGFDDDDIEGGAPKIPSGPPQTVRSTPPPSESSGEKSGPPPQRAGGPPLGPPRGPPKNENATSRKLSSASGTGPVQILAPSNNPSSPPASAFPPMGQPRPRVRPPPGNKQHTPYRPPERPSQAPVMYSQSGQPAFSQPFPQEANGSDDSTAQTPLLSQGLESASSSVRPREGGLHKRVVANDNNIKKADSPVNAPPSPKIHGLKGPAILSVSGQKTPSSATKTLKTWAIRGGLAYLGYTAVFNCAPDSTGVRGLYCKATNGVGGLIKPFVAPQYNAHVGPHVDRYIKPVARQGHKIYIKVADPVVQGALSAAGAVYKSTAKKHVDSAKDQVISILPYPFKSKADSSNEAEEPKEHPKSFEKVSRQPIHADEPHGSVDQDQHQGEEKSHLSETLEQIAEEVKETLEQVEEKVAEAKEAVLEHLKPVVETVHHVVEEAIEHVHHEEESKEVKHDHVVEQDSNGLGEEAHVVVDEVKKGDPILDSVNTFPDSMKKLDDDVADAQAAEEPQIETVTEAKEEMEERGHWYAAPDPEPVPTPELEVDPVPTANEPVAAEQEIEAPEPTPEATPVPVTEEIVAETTPAFADIPTPASKVPEAEPVPVEEHVETHVEPAAEAVQDTNTDTPTGDTHSEPHIQEEEESKASHEEQDTHPSEPDDEVAEEEQDSVVPKELEHEGEQADHRHEQQAAHVPEAGDSTSGHDEL